VYVRSAPYFDGNAAHCRSGKELFTVGYHPPFAEDGRDEKVVTAKVNVSTNLQRHPRLLFNKLAMRATVM